MKPARDIRSVLQEAMALHQQGKVERAEAIYRDVLTVMPEEPNSWHLLGVAAFQRGDLVTGEEFIRKAIQFHPHASPYYNNLGSILKQKGDLQGATEQFEQAFKLAPHDEMVRRHLIDTSLRYGAKLMGEKELEGAKAAYRRTLELEPGNVPTLNNLAMILQHEGDFSGAHELYDRALQNNPQHLAARYNRALCTLTEGLFTESWADIAATQAHWLPLQDDRKNVPWLACKLWDGSDLKGKKILLWGDQGIGDEILYMSMVPDLIARGAHVTIECMDRLVPLVARSFPQAAVVPRQTPLVPGSDFDFHAPGLWLGRWLRSDANAFPERQSFLKPDPEKTARLRERYKDMGRKRIVGISWFTLSESWGPQRSVALPDILAPLALEEMLIVDLQYGATRGAWQEAQDLFPALKMFRDPEINQLEDMDIYAAQIAACDYIVTISNTTSHVAGALGIPAAILTSQQGLTWYWLDKGENCPWYPSLRLLRPSDPNRLQIAAEEALRGK